MLDNHLKALCTFLNQYVVSMLASSAVYRGFEPRSGQIKTIKLVFVASPLSTHH